ncbi:sugar transferase [Paraclostridium bifermentans]|uniref:sugar transferase n=1 Tax=Paraclostridium bifermentans TaxID=1490 RepID=UPI003D29618F
MNNGTTAVYEDELYEESDVLDSLDYSLCKESLYYEVVTKVIDIILSLIGLSIGIPLIVLFGLLIKLEDGGPILYKQVRVGKYGKTFTLCKLRSMRVDAEKFGARWAQENDPRILKVGKFIRKTRIDEIPQLFNILKGDMTIVGPRPERPMFTYQFEEETPGFINRLLVKPGLTGLAQINGGYDMSYIEKLKWDTLYIKNKSIFMNMYIIVKTVGIVFTGKGAR